MSAITQDDLPIPPQENGTEEEAFVENQPKETPGAHDVVAVVPVSSGDLAQPTEDESRGSVPLIEPMSPANSFEPSQIGEEIDIVSWTKARKKKTRHVWGRKSSK